MATPEQVTALERVSGDVRTAVNDRSVVDGQ